MYCSLKYLIAGCAFSILVGAASINAVSPGFMEGHLKIISPKPVELAGENMAAKTADNYADYPLLVLSWDGQKEIARITADAEGNYRVALPPGDYVLDVQGRASKHVRAKPQRFTVVSNQTIRVDMDIDLDHSRSNSMQ
jgi:hypothetical protein